MKLKNIDLVANKLVKAFLTNKLISPIPIRYTKKINQACMQFKGRNSSFSE